MNTFQYLLYNINLVVLYILIYLVKLIAIHFTSALENDLSGRNGACVSYVYVAV